VTIGGDYVLGTGFLGLGVVLANEANFFRISRNRRPEQVNYGLVTLKAGADPDLVARELRGLLPNDVQVFTRPELAAHEISFWTTRTGTGLIFGSGLVVAFVVGIMVLYQTLATQIMRYLPEFATLKAIGYGDFHLATVVMIEAAIIVLVAFLPAAAAAFAIYAQIREATLLPLALASTQLASVLATALFMSGVSAFLSLSILRRADPADVF
jgi:putative ABC transport system permease protein